MFCRRYIIVPLIMLMFAAMAKGETVTVSAAISMKESLTDLRANYEAKTGDHLIFNFDASGKLAAQIEQGAPVDLFISADEEQMDRLDKSGHIDQETKKVLVNNTLVLVTAPDEKDAPTGFADLANGRGKKIAIGEPKTVPAGRYAMQVLKATHVDQAVTPRLLLGESVRQVLTYVEQDEVCGGIVYGTDAKQAGDKVKVIATADAATHEPIEYPAAVVKNASHSNAAARFLAYLSSEPAQKVFVSRGFVIPQVQPAATQAASTRPAP